MADADRPDLEELDWSVGQRSASLARVFSHAVGLANGAERWYADARRTKRRWGQNLRVGAIMLGGLAAVLPIISQIYTRNGRPVIAAGWATIALAVAATLIALDRYYGFSAGWMRFMTAEMRIARLRHQFQYEWESSRVSAPDPPSDEEVMALLLRAREFVLAIDDAVTDETSGWITEFRSNLERAEQSLERAQHV